MTNPGSRLDRRHFLLAAGAAALAACTSSEDEAASTTSSDDSGASTSSSTADSTTTTLDTSDDTGVETEAEAGGELEPLTPAMFTSLPICAVLPSTTAGPFPTFDQLDRRDVTEGYPGHPLRLGIRVVDRACEPLAGAAVEIWHTDATGDYSSYDDNGSGKDEGAGTTFMRGFQTSDADGILEFHTLYPGWYEGRAVHIHIRVRVDGQEVLTSQLYLDESYTEQVFLEEPYAEFGPPDTTWASDGIAGNPIAEGSAITVTAGPTLAGPGTLGLANLGVPV